MWTLRVLLQLLKKFSVYKAHWFSLFGSKNMNTGEGTHNHISFSGEHPVAEMEVFVQLMW